MTTSIEQPPNLRDRAVGLAIKGLYVIPLCWPDEAGRCGCPKRHTGHNIGKAPLTPRGVNDSSDRIRDIWNWWDQWPNANIGIDLDKSGLVDIAPDSPEWHEIFKARGLPETAAFQSGGGEGHVHYLYWRPEGTPLININISDAYDIQPRGYAVAPGSLHQSRRTYQWVSDHPWRDVEDLPFAPDWALAEIQQKWEARSAVPDIDVDLSEATARPDLVGDNLRPVALDDGEVDRSKTLFLAGLKLANQGATPEEIVATLREMDESQGFQKYSRRRDGGAKAYSDIARSVSRYPQYREVRDPGLTWEQVERAVAETPRGTPYYEPKPVVAEENVAGMVRRKKGKPSYQTSDISDPRSALWETAKKHFPFPSGVKPWVVSTWLYSERDQKAMAADFLSHGWENSANAQHNRQCLFFNLFPRLNTRQLYELLTPLDDWSPKLHKAVERRLQRKINKLEESGNEGVGYVWVDNALDRGYFRYLTTAPGVKGFTPVDEDVEALLVDTLDAIHPVKKEGGGKFHPYGVSANWRRGVESTGEQDKGRWRKTAVKKGPTDFIQVEAECVAEGTRAEMTRPYWRGQYGPGLEMKLSLKESVEIAFSLGYSITRYARRVLAEEKEVPVDTT